MDPYCFLVQAAARKRKADGQTGEETTPTKKRRRPRSRPEPIGEIVQVEEGAATDPVNLSIALKDLEDAPLWEISDLGAWREALGSPAV